MMDRTEATEVALQALAIAAFEVRKADASQSWRYLRALDVLNETLPEDRRLPGTYARQELFPEKGTTRSTT